MLASLRNVRRQANEIEIELAVESHHLIFTNHHVYDSSIMPAVAYLEIVREVVKATLAKDVLSFRRTHWLSPLRCSLEETLISIRLCQTNDCEYAFSAFDMKPRGKRVFCEGLINVGLFKIEEMRAEIDKPDISSFHTTYIDHDIYSHAKTLGLDYGDAFQRINSVHLSNNMALGIYKANEMASDPTNLNPAILDASLHPILMMAPAATTHLLYLPFSVERIDIHNPLTSKLKTSVKFSEESKNKEQWKKLVKVDVDLLGDRWQKLVSFTGLSLKRTEKAEFCNLTIDKNAQLSDERFLSVEDKGLLESRIDDVDHHSNLQSTEDMKRSNQFEEYLLQSIVTYLKELIAGQIGLQGTDLNVNESFEKFDLSSTKIIEITRKLETKIGELPVTIFFEYDTIKELAVYLIERHKEALKNAFPQQDRLLSNESDMVESNNNDQINVYPNAKKNRSNRIEICESPLDVAIIGMSVKFPMADNQFEFWKMLREEKNCITLIPENRWSKVHHRQGVSTTQGSNIPRWGGFINGIEQFDPLFFNISPREASFMTPQERLFLEAAWNAIEDAGYTKELLCKTNFSHSSEHNNVGVFVGVMYDEYQLLAANATYSQDVVSCNTSSIANRVSYYLNLGGPSIAVDTMCSSSLTAVKLACDNIRSGESFMALAGGVNVSIHPNKYRLLSKGGFLSESGQCQSFGKYGDGYVPSEGVGCILLKSLSNAIKDNDRIYGVIKGIAINHGGRTRGYTVPSPRAQKEVISNALKQSKVDSKNITYIEAHGTGTQLGDPIEIKSLSDSFGNEKKQYCAIGSVKSNIGHTESAAGIAGIAKVLLQMKHGKLAASLHATEQNSNIDFLNSPFYVQKTLTEWPRIEVDGQIYPRTAGISSFGAGGSNAHLVIQEHLTDAQQFDALLAQTPFFKNEDDSADNCTAMVPLSARTPSSLKEYARSLLKFLADDIVIMDGVHSILSLCNLAYTLQIGREAMKQRVVFVVRDLPTLEVALTHFISDQPHESVYSDDHVTKNLLNGEMIGSEKNFAAYDDIFNTAAANYDLIAKLWVGGKKVDWTHLYTTGLPQKISLPTYPFAKESYWYPSNEASPLVPTNTHDQPAIVQQETHLHPLLHHNTSDFTAQRYHTQLTGTELFLTDHRVNGHKVMPGVSYLEMARAAVEHASGQHVSGFERVVWLNPLVLSDHAVTLKICLWLDNGLVAYEIYTDQYEQRLVYSQGWVKTSAEKRAPDLLPVRTLTALTAEGQWQSGQSHYDTLQRLGLGYGDYFQTVQELWVSEKSCVTRLASGGDHAIEAFRLPPDLLDGALQGIAALHRSAEPQLALPFAIDTIELFSDMPARGYASIRQMHGTAPRYAIEVLNEAGEVCVSFTGLSVRTVDATTLSRLGPVVSAPKSSDTATVLYGTAAWVPQPLREAVSTTENESHVWLCGREVQAPMLLPGCQLHTLVLVDHDQLSSQSIAAFHQLFNWLQTLMRSKPKTLQRIVVVMVADAVTQVAFAPLEGLLKTACRESANIEGKLLWLTPEEGASDEVAHRVEAELRHWHNPEMAVRIRNGLREVKTYREVTPDATLHASLRQPVTLQHGGVYWITGGLGGLGYVIAQALGRQVNATLLLSGRSALSDSSQARLVQLHHEGIKADYLQGDISQRSEVERLYAEIVSRYGRLNGVIHCAGITRDAFIVKKDIAELSQVLAPKIAGLQHLDEVTREAPLDFMLLFSSLASVLGNVGQGDYAGGNAFMDSYSEYRNQLVERGLRQGKTIAINWPLWEEGGMQIDEQSRQLLQRQTGLTLLPTQAGLQAFMHSLSLPYHQLLVMPGEAEALRAKLLSATRVVTAPLKALINSIAQQEPYVQGVVKQQISEVLKIRESDLSGIDEEMSSYGFDSITLTELSNRLNDVLGIDLMPTVFFEHTSIGALSRHIAHRYGEQLTSRSSPSQITASQSVSSKPSLVDQTETAQRRFLQPNNTRFTQPQASANTLPTNDDDQIAIVGMSGRFPEAPTLADYWQNLVSEKDCISEVAAWRWDWRTLLGEEQDETLSKRLRWGGFMAGIDEFDAAFFGISPREAAIMDPQQRLFLEMVWRALEEGGIRPSSLAGSKTGLFVGVATTDYHDLLIRNNITLEGHTATGHAHSILANRISYLLDLHGPSEPVDTACSSSLVALHRACQSIRNNECDMAIVGGVNVLLNPDLSIMFGKAGMLSEEGRCKTFAQGANGYVRGEGVGVVILKRLSHAKQDRHPIHAILKGSGINHGGMATSLTAPNPNAQADLLCDVYQRAGIDPRSVGYIEAHGTGTALGDPIEINGLKLAFDRLYQACGHQTTTWDSSETPVAHCGLGSVKTNIGHLEAGAGMASLLKVILALKHKVKPASLHAEQVNDYIQLAESPFYIVQKTEAWVLSPREESATCGKRRAGISSFGFGGVNAHVILEEYDQAIDTGVDSGSDRLVTLSAKNSAVLTTYAKQLADYLETVLVDTATMPKLCDLAYTYQVGRESFPHRVGFIVNSVAELREKLWAYSEGQHNITQCYQGTSQSNTTELLLEGEEGHRFIQQLISNKKLSKLAQLWVNGIDIDWSLLYEDGEARTLSLPTYPFERRRYWFAANSVKENAVNKDQSKNEDQNNIGETAHATSSLTQTTQMLRPMTNLVKTTAVGLEKTAASVISSKVNNKIQLASPTSLENTYGVDHTLGHELQRLSQEQPGKQHQKNMGDLLKKSSQRDLRALLAATLHLRAEEIEESKTFADLGVDSILGVELIKTVNKTYGLAIKSAELFDYPTLPQLAGYIDRLLLTVPQVHLQDSSALANSAFEETVLLEDQPDQNRLHQNSRQQNSAIKGELKRLLAATLHLAEEEIDESKTFADLGVDSILGVELIKTVNKTYGCDIKSAELFDYPTLAALSDRLALVLSEAPLLQTEQQQFEIRQGEKSTAKPVVKPMRKMNGQDNHTANCSDQSVSTAKQRIPSDMKQQRVNATDDIAVVGLSCCLPGASDKNAYWDLLKAGNSAITEIPEQRWPVEGFYSDTVNSGETSISKWGGFIEHPEHFDPLFFHISPQEAEVMDPQQRLFLQASWKALEDAGYAPRHLSGMRCGVFAGVMNNDYAMLSRHPKQSHVYEMTGNSNAILAARIAYFLNLKGPSLAIDTACSSSLVALHLACNSLRHGEVDMALAGGVSLYLDPKSYILMSKGGMLSADGRCKTFDRHANGFVPGEGVGVVVLKRLSEAQQAGDPIYGVIKGTGINQDGKTSGITAPSAISQSDLTLSVYRDYHINPETISYVEAHGTGTVLGDPVEINGLKRSFSQYTDKTQYCAIGSVKTNLGHTSGAAGVAGLIKLLLCLQHKQLVPTLNYEETNPDIDFESSPFYVNTQLKTWAIEPGQKRRAAINAFGFSGTNAHAVVEEYCPDLEQAVTSDTPQQECLFVLSARTQAQLKEYAESFLAYLQHRELSALPRLDSLTYTLQTGRDAMVCRLALVVASYEELQERLRVYLDNPANGEGCCVGQVKSTHTHHQQLVAGKAGEAFLSVVIKERELSKLAELWVNGVEIEWSGLYGEGGLPSRVPLPTYPFAKESYWCNSIISVVNEGQRELHEPTKKIHPLLGANISTLECYQFETVFSGEEHFLRDHLVHKRKILPGSAQLEMARLAAEVISQKTVGKITDIEWLRMIDIDRSADVCIKLQGSVDSAKQLKFSIEQQDGRAYSKGIVHISEESRIDKIIDLESVEKRCNKILDKEDIYRLFTSIGLDYGASFKTLNWIKHNSSESIAKLSLDSTLLKERDYLFQPTIIDGVMQSILGLSSSTLSRNGDAVVPTKIGAIEQFSSLKQAEFAYVTRSTHTIAGEQLFDIEVIDNSGLVLMQLRRVVMSTMKSAKQKEKYSVNIEQRKLKEKLKHISDKKLLELLKSLESKRAAQADPNIYEAQDV